MMPPSTSKRQSWLTRLCTESTAVLDSPAKRTRRTLRNISDTENSTTLAAVYDVENDENQQPCEDSQDEVKPTPAKSQSRRASIATTTKSCKHRLRCRLRSFALIS